MAQVGALAELAAQQADAFVELGEAASKLASVEGASDDGDMPAGGAVSMACSIGKRIGPFKQVRRATQEAGRYNARIMDNQESRMTEVSRTLVQPVRKTIRTGELSRARVDAVTQQVKIVEEREDGKLVERIEAHGPPDYEVIRAGGEVVGTHTDSGHADQALEVLELEAQAKIDLPLEENTERSTLGKKIKIKK